MESTRFINKGCNCKAELLFLSKCKLDFAKDTNSFVARYWLKHVPATPEAGLFFRKRHLFTINHENIHRVGRMMRHTYVYHDFESFRFLSFKPKNLLRRASPLKSSCPEEQNPAIQSHVTLHIVSCCFQMGFIVWWGRKQRIKVEGCWTPRCISAEAPARAVHYFQCVYTGSSCRANANLTQVTLKSLWGMLLYERAQSTCCQNSHWFT